MRRTRRRLNKMRRFIRLSGGDRVLTFEATLFLAVARVWLLIVPFRAIAQQLGTGYEATKVLALPSISDDQETIASKVSGAVKRAAKNTPFRTVCIQQAIAAKLMLRRRGIPSAMHFGVRLRNAENPERMKAHAWLNTANAEIVGFPIDDGLIEIAYFV